MNSAAFCAALSRLWTAHKRIVIALIALAVVAIGSWSAYVWWTNPYRNMGGHPRYVVLRMEMECLVHNIYREARSEPYEGQLMVAYVHAQRREANRPDWGGNTYCGTMSHPFQFSWYNDKRLRFAQPRNEKALETARAVVNQVTAGWKPQGELARAQYYLYQRASSQRSICWFRRSLVLVGKVGNHEFYAEPTVAERKKLARAPTPAECRKKKEGKNTRTAQR